MSQTITPYLVTSNAAAAIEFYKQAFGAEELARHSAPNDTRIMHVHLRLFGSEIMMSDDFSDHMGGVSQTPQALGGSPITLSLLVEDADSVWEKAVAAGAIVTMPLKDQFWGDRYGQITDPFGHKWSVSQRKQVLTKEQVAEGAKESFAKSERKRESVAV